MELSSLWRNMLLKRVCQTGGLGQSLENQCQSGQKVGLMNQEIALCYSQAVGLGIHSQILIQIPSQTWSRLCSTIVELEMVHVSQQKHCTDYQEKAILIVKVRGEL